MAVRPGHIRKGARKDQKQYKWWLYAFTGCCKTKSPTEHRQQTKKKKKKKRVQNYYHWNWTVLKGTATTHTHTHTHTHTWGVSKSFQTGRLEREMQILQLFATRCSCISILWVSLVSFAAITLCVASQRVFIVSLSTQSGHFWIHSRRTKENWPTNQEME
jgi:hypothetical protein